MVLRYSPFIILLMGLSGSIFYFLQDNDPLAIDILFIGIYFTIFTLFVSRLLFYAKHKATLNELFFYVFSNMAVILVLLFSKLTTYATVHYYTFSVITSSINNVAQDSFDLVITPITFLILPYLLISSTLQLRAFTRYEFIRYTPTSEKGINAEWMAIIIFFVVGALFSVTSSMTNDLLAFFYGTFYLFLGISFLLGK